MKPLSPFIKNIIWALPLYVLVPIPFIYLAHFVELELDSYPILLGALGWWGALILRIPIILLIQKRDVKMQTASKITIGISGLAEEIVRLFVLLIIGLNTNNAFAVGLGWASIEIVYGLIQIIGLAVLDNKTDAKAQEAKALMKQMGMDKTLSSSVPFWGALERVSASALHIGFSLLLVVNPYSVIITIPVHSLVNFFVVNMNKRSIGKAQLGLLIIGSAILLLSLALL